MSSGHAVESKEPVSIVHWASDPRIIESLNISNISIVPLSSENQSALVTMVKKNQEVDGFVQMKADIFTGKVFDEILSGKSAERCYVAYQKFTKDVIGFVVFNNEEKMGYINEIGVDSSCTFRAEHKAHNVGCSLLLVACNDMLSSTPEIKEIGVLASTADIAAFYERFQFKKINEDEEEGEPELALSSSNYKTFESTVLARSPAKAPTRDTTEATPITDKAKEKPDVTPPPPPLTTSTKPTSK